MVTSRTAQALCSQTPWVSVDRADITQVALPLPDYIDHVSNQVDKLTNHSYVSKCQAKYLKDLKDSLLS